MTAMSFQSSSATSPKECGIGRGKVRECEDCAECGEDPEEWVVAPTLWIVVAVLVVVVSGIVVVVD